MNIEDYKSYLQALVVLEDPNYSSDLASSMINHGLDLSTALADKLRAFMIMEPVAFHDLVMLVRRPKITTIQRTSLDLIHAWHFGIITYPVGAANYSVKIAGPVKTFIRQSVCGRGLVIHIK